MALTLAAGLGCSSTQEDPSIGEISPGENTVVVEVDNGLIPPRTVTVVVDPPTELERILGVVHARESRRFEIDTRDMTAGYRLIAELSNGSVIESDPVDALSNATVRWDLFENTLVVDRAN